jgi:uncharacterized protein (DUF1015 family)
MFTEENTTKTLMVEAGSTSLGIAKYYLQIHDSFQELLKSTVFPPKSISWFYPTNRLDTCKWD